MEKWQMKPTIYVGNDCLSRLKRFSNERICLVCDPYLIGTDNLNKIVDQFPQSATIEVFSEVIPDPPIETVALGVEKMLRHKPTILIAVGGGSAIDTAKGMLFTYLKLVEIGVKEFVAIPTTSGTGSEVTSASVITDTQNKMKYPIFHPTLVPTEALLDGQLVVTSPPTVTAYSGMDVLTHGLEALVAKGSTIYTDALAEKAIEVTFEYLLTCVLDGENVQARNAMHQASCLAGLAFDQAGLGISHGLAHQVGAQFKVPHGLANAMLLPHVVAANSQQKQACQKYGDIAKKIGISPLEVSDQLASKRLQEAIKKLTKATGCPQTLSQFGIKVKESQGKTKEIVTNAQKDITFASNPVAFDAKAIKDIYQKII